MKRSTSQTCCEAPEREIPGGDLLQCEGSRCRASNAFVATLGADSEAEAVPAGASAGGPRCAVPSIAGSGGDPGGGGLEVLSPPLPLSIHEEKDTGHGELGAYGEITSEVQDGQSSGVQFVRRVGRYGRARARALELAEWLTGQRAKLLEGADLRVVAGRKLRGCGGYLEFRQYPTLAGLPIKLHAGRFCQQPTLCGLCAIRRSTKLLRSYVPKLATVLKGGGQLYFVTLTARNGDDLSERYAHIVGGLRGIHRAGWYSRKGQKGWHPWAVVDGSVFSLEFKRGQGTRGGGWHPHAHGIIVCGEPLETDQAEALLISWCEYLGDADQRGQDIARLHSLADLPAEAQTEADLIEGLGGDLVEVFKYPLKFGALCPEDRWQAACVVRGRHLIRPTGCLRGVRVDASYVDEPFDAKDLPYLELLLRYCPEVQGYRLARRIFIDS